MYRQNRVITVFRKDQARLCAPAVFTICSLKLPLLPCAWSSGSADIGICLDPTSCCSKGGCVEK